MFLFQGQWASGEVAGGAAAAAGLMAAGSPPAAADLRRRLSAWASGGSAGPPPLLDLRPADDFRRVALRGSTSVPLGELPQRWLELPPRERSFALLVPPGSTLDLPTRSGETHKWTLTHVFESSNALWEAAAELKLSETPGDFPGPPLWSPCPLLAEHLPDIERRVPLLQAGGTQPSSSTPPPPLRCLDVGCGAGRDTVYLASRGHLVRSLDVRSAQLERLAGFAERSGYAGNISCEKVNLRDSAAAAAALRPGAGCDLAVVVRFLHRPLLAQLAQHIRPGGCLVYEHFLAGSEGMGGPSRPEDRLDPGELQKFFGGLGWDLAVADDSGTLPDGRPVARLVAFKPPN